MAAQKLPVVFIGHGNPMNALAHNKYSRALETLAREIPRPKAVLCVSAHWLTRDARVTHSASPETIHDFSGFPPELFAVRYPAPGSPALAEWIQKIVAEPAIALDSERGLDHGAWSVLRHMYPDADMPIVQLGIDIRRPPQYHFAFGRALKKLRENGILILGSGNIVHNLARIRWEANAPAYDWAAQFDEWVKDKLAARDFAAIRDGVDAAPGGPLSVPTPDHWYPLLYVLGASNDDDKLDFPYEGVENGSISMRCVRLQ